MIKLTIWNREFELETVFDCYPGEEILQSQRDALSNLISNNQVIEDSEKQVKDYCLKNNKQDIGNEITNIFKYVMPEAIFVKRDGRVAIMCRYKFDIEHGIAVVYSKNKFDTVGTQDIIL